MQNLKQHFSYKKFKNCHNRLMLLDKNYFLQNQMCRDLKRMGHELLTVKVEEDPKKMLESVLKSAVAFRPDAIISMNHQGLDREGQIASLLERLEIPLIIWYLDDFRFILPNYESQVCNNILLFTFEKSNLPHLKALGFEKVFYLPSATAIDHSSLATKGGVSDRNNSVVFIGNSFENTKKRWLRPGYQSLMDELEITREFTLQGEKFIAWLKNLQGDKFEHPEAFYHYCGYVSAHVTQMQRTSILKQLSGLNLHVYGDAYWSEILDDIPCHPGVNQEVVAPQIFMSAGINLNISSSQLETAVNLRVYDVPLSGGFLLTDWKESLAELFDPANELAVYHTREELHDKCRYFINNTHEAEAVMNAARERIQREHLLIHRLDKILTLARTCFC